MPINILQFIAGGIFLYYGAEFLISSSQEVAVKFTIPPIIIGITLVALGTSLPELVVSIMTDPRIEPGTKLHVLDLGVYAYRLPHGGEGLDDQRYLCVPWDHR